MAQRFTRRRFGAAAIATASVAVAGCLGDDDEEFEPGAEAVDLLVILEDEDGESVSDGIEVTVEHEDGDSVTAGPPDIIEGQFTANTGDPGEYTVTVTSLEEEDDFEEAQETIELEATEDDDEEEDEEVEEITMVLEGALSDAERAEMEDGE